MEIPPGARLEKGSWHYQRHLPPLQPLSLGRTPQAGDYQLCFLQQCHEMSEWLGPPISNPASVDLWSCRIRSGQH
ncbi:hypothetical protein PG5_44680 [Pseudomonas sp. G5(2012)]|nr:hypothetical protein PG5_44680 [Pseudomonas sp. G5(2012)]